MENDVPVRVSHEGSVTHLVLNRPNKLNAINYEVIALLLEALDEARDNPDVRAVLLRGEGRAFCAGDDVVDMGSPRYPVQPGEHVVRHMQQRLIRNWYWFPKPTVAAVHGRAHGIGGDLMLAADFRIVGEGFIFGDLRARRAIPVGSGGTWLLPRMIGLSRATAIMLTGGTIGSDEMESYGLAHDVVPVDDVVARATEFASTIAAGPTKALGIMKHELRSGLTQSFDDSLDLEIALLDESVEDRSEGVQSFREGRDPSYTGR